MINYFPFTPSSKTPPSFSPVFDGVPYNCKVIWNLFGQRFYVNCYNQNSNLIFSVALIETKRSALISNAVWNAATLRVTITTAMPHKLKIGSTINLVIDEMMPSAYNGNYFVLITGPNTFTYELNTDPGQMVTAGNFSYLINLCKGYFNSIMIYRNGQFEVSP